MGVLERLSDAQNRWARIAIGLSFVGWSREDDPDAQGFLVLDEPERALHTLAERHLIHGLLWASEYLHASALVATHSRELLNSRGTQIFRVYRDAEGQTTLSALTTLDREALEPADLGISLADVLQYFRVFLAVEGKHDEEVLSALIGSELREAAVHLMPMRGAKALEVANAHVLLTFTDAKLVVVMDALGSSELPRIWEEIRAEDLSPHVLRKRLEPFLDDGLLEVRAGAAFCSTALTMGVADRVFLFGLKQRDIIEYLPADSFVEGAESWWPSIEEWKQSRSLLKVDFKEWLRKQKGARISAKRLREVAMDMPEVPEEIKRLAEFCRELAAS